MTGVLGGLTWVDWATLAILTGSLLLGVMRGVVREVFSLAAWGVAFWLARSYGLTGASWLAAYIQSESMRLMAGFALVFVAGWIAMVVVGMLFNALVTSAGLGPLNRILGGVFGLLRGALIVVVLALLAGMTSLPAHRDWKNAWSAEWSETAVRWLLPYLPTAMAERVHF